MIKGGWKRIVALGQRSRQWMVTSELLLFVIMVIALQALALPANLASRDPDTLVAKSLDEEAFRVVLYQIHRGIDSGTFAEMAPPTFLAYGWTFFFVNAVSTYWFNDWPSAVIVIPRLVSTFAGTLSLWFIYKIARFWLGRPQALLLATMILFLPDFYANAFWIHPEHPVVAPMVASLYFLIRDRSQLRRNFYYALVCLGIALTMKLTALLFFAVPLGYLGYQLIWRRQCRWYLYILAAAGVGVVPVLTVGLLNPSIFLAGRITLIREFLRLTMESYAHNTELLTPQILWQTVVGPNYMIYSLALIFLILGIIGSVYELRARATQPVILLTTLWSYGFLYYTLVRVGGHLAHYYLPVFTFVPLLAISLVYILKKPQAVTYGISALLLIQVVTQWPEVVGKFVQDIAGTKSRDLSMTEALVLDNKIVSTHAAILLKAKNIQPTSVLVSAFLPFPASEFPTLNPQLPRIYGYLNEGQIRAYGLPEIIIVSKAESYFYDLTDPVVMSRLDYADIKAAQIFIEDIKRGKQFDANVTYQVIADDNILLMLQKHTAP